MRKAVCLGILALCAAPAIAADTAKCDATAFTLAKPAPAVKHEKPQAAPQPAPKVVPPKVAEAKPKPKTSSRLLSTCKDGKPKKGS